MARANDATVLAANFSMGNSIFYADETGAHRDDGEALAGEIVGGEGLAVAINEAVSGVVAKLAKAGDTGGAEVGQF